MVGIVILKGKASSVSQIVPKDHNDDDDDDDVSKQRIANRIKEEIKKMTKRKTKYNIINEKIFLMNVATVW